MVAGEFTQSAHSLSLGSLANYFLAISRIISKDPSHEIERGGIILTTIGVFFVVVDSLTLEYFIVPE